MMAALSLAAVPAADASNDSPFGPFQPFFTDASPECVPLETFTNMSTVVELNGDQFQFIRAIFIATPPASFDLPVGDRAIEATAGDVIMLGLVADGAVCTRFVAPPFLVAMLKRVGAGDKPLPGEGL